MTPKTPEKRTSHPIRRLKAERETALALPRERAVDWILDTPQPAALVHSFPEEDLYLLIQDIGPEDALPVLALASDRQVDFLFDMEVWNGDRIDIGSTQRWVSLLFQADPVHSIRWFMDTQIEFFEHYLHRNLEVRIREHDQDPSDFGEGFISVDNVFFVRPAAIYGEKEAEAEQRRSALLQMLNRAADRDHVKYQKILLEAAALIPSECEEEIYRMRNVRLAEKGFLPYEEAVGIYQPLKPGDFSASAQRYDHHVPDTGQPAPLTPAAVVPPGGLFAEALARISSSEKMEQVQVQFATLCNRLAVVDREKIKDRETLAAVVKKASGYLGIGLESIAGDDRPAGCVHTAALVSDYPLSQIFRVGYGFAQELKWRAENWRKTSWFESVSLPLTFWGEEWLGVVGGLLIKRPLFFDNYRTGTLYREFASLTEIRITESTMKQIIAFDKMLSRMGIRLPEMTDPNLLSHKNLTLTLWSRHYLGLRDEVLPLSPSQLKRFFNTLWAGSSKPRAVSAAMKDIFLSWVADRSAVSTDRVSDELGATFDALFTEIEEEYGRMNVTDLDPKYSMLFLVQGT